MPKKRSVATKLTGAGIAGVVAAMVLGAGPAHAEGAETHQHESSGDQASNVQQSELYDPIVVANPQTAASYQSGRGKAELRVGTHNGTQYGWGRAIGASGNDWIRFEMDTNGDRVWDYYDAWKISERIYTAGYSTSSSSDRAFRACIVTQPGNGCSSGGNGTYWW